MDAARRVITYPTALTSARRRFVSSGALPMDALAGDLWVSRATLYRVAGSRDRLLGDVLWQLSSRTLTLATQDAAAAGLVGVDRLLEISRHFHARVAGFAPLQRFLREEPADAVRVLFGSTGRVHERAVQAWADLLRQALESGELAGLPFGVEQTAYVYVRIGESMLYGDMLAGIVPDGALSEHLRRTVLCAPPPSSSAGFAEV